jgi:hypothetical protein
LNHIRRGSAESRINILLTPNSRSARNRGSIGFILADDEVDLSQRRLDCRERGICQLSIAEVVSSMISAAQRGMPGRLPDDQVI